MTGHSWGATVALDLAARHPRSVAAAVLVDGGLSSLRETMDWPTAKEQLAPPRLAGMPVEEFRGTIRTFLGGAVEVTPEVEDIVLSVMHVDRRGRIRPRLSRANHLRILRSIWLDDPDAALARLSVPTLAVLARGAGDPDWDARKRRAAERARHSGAPIPDQLARQGSTTFRCNIPTRSPAGSNVSPTDSYDDRMGWVILFLVLLAAAFGVLGPSSRSRRSSS